MSTLLLEAIPISLDLAAAQSCPGQLTFDWKHTSTLGPLTEYHGVWCVPGSPYASEGAAIGTSLRALLSKLRFSLPVMKINGTFR
jgi:hypothetical protein